VIVLKAHWPVMAFFLFALTFLLVACGGDAMSMHFASAVSTVNKGGDQPVPTASTGWTTQSPLVWALIWASIIIVIGAVLVFFLRFYSKHNEHPVLDDRPSSEIWERGLHNYLRIMGKEEDEEKQEANR
jgi:multisubunit Na+/H+ antiporter MnhC subunit